MQRIVAQTSPPPAATPHYFRLQFPFLGIAQFRMNIGSSATTTGLVSLTSKSPVTSRQSLVKSKVGFTAETPRRGGLNDGHPEACF